MSNAEKRRRPKIFWDSTLGVGRWAFGVFPFFIERAFRRITMSASGPIGKRHCLDGSLRSDLLGRRHPPFSAADSLPPERCSLVVLVQQVLAAEQAAPKFPWPVWPDW